jgi:small subunit ribosomal protein S6
MMILALKKSGLYIQKEEKMNRYETIFILESDIQDAEREPMIEKITALIPQHDGVLILKDDWGNRKLAYPIKKKMHGRYIRLDYCGTGPLVDDLERFFRLDHRVLKYMTIQLDANVDPEAIQEALKSQQTETSEQSETAPADAGAEGGAPEMAEEAPSDETIQPESVTQE